MNNLENKAWELIKKASSITLLTHSKPDGDGISACVACEMIFTKLNKKVETVYPDTPEFEYKRQPRNFFIGEHKQHPDLIISLDSANYGRIYYPEEFHDIDLINIDHHVSNSIKGTVNFVEGDSASACEVLYKLLKSWCKELIDKDVAEAILFGLLDDTQVFRTAATNSETLLNSAELIDLGADLFKIKVELLSNKSPRVVKLWSLLLGRVEVDEKKSLSWCYIKQEDLKKLKLELSSLVGFGNFLSEISGIDVSLLFYETAEGKTKLSLRSKYYDVNKLASKFGGGGHKNASGVLSDRPIDEFVKEVVESV